MNRTDPVSRTRRALVLAGAALPLPLRSQAPLKKLLLLDFELIDEQRDEVPFPEAPARLATIAARLRAAIAREKLYELVDHAPVADLLRSVRRQQNILNCNGCELDIARQAGAERIMLGWVQKVSNLILNINLEVRDVTSGRTVLAKSVDLRGNTDASWQRGIDFLVRDMVDKGQGNR